MGALGFPTPEDAVLSTFDLRWARVITVRWFDEDHGEVELMTNEPPHDYLYFVEVHRVGDNWYEGNSSNGSAFRFV